jgi:hypothetical protein
LLVHLPVMDAHRRDWLAFSLLAVTTLGLAAWAWTGLLAYQTLAPDFDETVHLLPALQIALDLKRLDLGAFLAHTYNQDRLALYPFLHSWLTAPFFLFGPPSVLTARTSSLVFFAGSVLVTYWVSGELQPNRDWRWLAGLAGGGLTLGALPLWSTASVTYLEPAGLLVSLLALFAYMRASPEQATRRQLILVSLLGTAALFLKYQYGLFVLGGIGLAEILGWLAARRNLWTRWLDLFGPAMLIGGLWFANPEHAGAFLDYSHAQHSNEPVWTLASLAYYPSNILRQYAAGPVAAALVLLGLLVALAHWREHRSRAVVTYLGVGLAILFLVPQKGPRFDYTVAPLALALAGLATSEICLWLQHRPWRRAAAAGQVAAWVLVGVLAIGVAQRLVWLPAAQELAYTTSPDTARAYAFLIQNTLAAGHRPYVLNAWYLFSPQTINWEYARAGAIDPAAGQYQVVGSSLAVAPDAANLAALRETLTAQGADVLVTIDGSPAGEYPGWADVQPLWAQGYLEPLADSERYEFYSWADTYRDAVFDGTIASAANRDSARAAGRSHIQIRLHLYRLR